MRHFSELLPSQEFDASFLIKEILLHPKSLSALSGAEGEDKEAHYKAIQMSQTLNSFYDEFLGEFGGIFLPSSKYHFSTKLTLLVFGKKKSRIQRTL